MTDLPGTGRDPLEETTADPTPSPDATSGSADHGTVAPVVTAPVGSGGPARRSSSRMRWFAALAIVTLVVAGSAAATLMLTGASPSATVTGYVPADSVMYGEVRLDLPGDQKRAIGEFLSKFPGFADQAALDTKLDEVLDRLVSDATDGEQTFTADIKPWFDGEMAFAVGPVPEVAAQVTPEAMAGAARGLLLMSIKDEALARTWFDGVMSGSGVQGTAESYAGVELLVFTDPGMPGLEAAFAIVDGKVAVAGDVASVKAAVDTDGDNGLAASPDFEAAKDAIDGDHVGYLYLDLESLTATALDLARSAPDSPQVGDSVLALVPDWTAFGLRVEGDALVMDGAMPHGDAVPGPDSNHANAVAEHAPAATIMLAARNDVGATIEETLDLLRSEPAFADVVAGLDQVSGVLGGPEAAIGWMGDAGVVISQAADAVEGGLVVVPTDPDAARQLLTTVRSFVLLGGGEGITIRDEEYAGTTITIVDLGSAQDLVGMAGALGGETLPTDPSSVPLPDGNIELAFAATDDVVVVGSGPGFVKSVLDAGQGSSLADEARYRDLVQRVGQDHTGIGFVDVAALRAIMEDSLASASGADRAEYEESVKPFLTPFDAVVAASVVGSDVDTQRVVITVK